jgi:hypothetical protein
MSFDRLPPEEYHALCLVVFGRDHYRCRHCKYRQNLTAHHIIFRSEGGPDATWNLVTLCDRCHSAVHRYELEIYSDNEEVGADGILKFERVNGWRPT